MKPLIPILAATAALTLSGTGVQATDSNNHRSWPQVTTGRFETLPGGDDLGYRIRGRAIMIRVGVDDGDTYVAVRIRGLDPDTTYPTHVHNQPCSATPAGGTHYQHVVAGAVDDVNEIWPIIQTDARGRGFGFADHEHRARADAQSIVVHYPADTSVRLACVDLR